MRALLAWLLLLGVASAQTAVGPFYIGAAGQPGLVMNGGASTNTMDSSGDKVTFVVSVTETGTISKIGLWMGTTTAGDTLNVALKTVGTDGLPTSTNYGSSTPGTIVVANGDDNKAIECTLGTAASTATAGDLIAVVITFNSYVAGNLQIGSMGASQTGPPFTLYDSGSGYADSQKLPKLYFYYSSDSSYRIPLNCLPPCIEGAYTNQSDTSPDEVGIQFTSPVAMRLCGATFNVREFGSTAEINIDVFDNHASAPTSLLTNRTVITHDTIKNINYASTFALEPEELTAGQVVNVAIFSEDATNNLSVRYLEVSDAAHWGDFAQGMTVVTRTRTDDTPGGGPGFTAVTTRKLIGGLWFDQITTSGGSSNITDPLSNSIGL